MNASGLFTQAEMREVWAHKLDEAEVLPHLAEILEETAASLELDPLPAARPESEADPA